ncbi:MAG: hypothetical protein M5U07_02380 [Xanthobacteraceae bacterium]|nr:hypothetical protein [Xanthobacteraceae bacterium]
MALIAYAQARILHEIETEGRDGALALARSTKGCRAVESILQSRPGHARA